MDARRPEQRVVRARGRAPWKESGEGGGVGRRIGPERVRLDGARDLVLLLELGRAREERVVLAAADEEEREQAERDDARDAADGPADDRADVARLRGGGARREPNDGLAVLRDVEDAIGTTLGKYVGTIGIRGGGPYT